MIRRMFGYLRPPLTLLDLEGAAEMANGIEKYGGKFQYMQKIMIDLSVASPRSNCIITGIGICNG